MENGAKTGYVHSLESFGSVDGPGVRYVIFLSGCAMRCQFCHNPDTWNMTAGKSYTADALLKQAVKYRTYWGNKGGITVSGGEPLLQIDFLIELFRKAGYERQSLHGKRAILFKMAGTDEIHRSDSSGYQAY